MNFIKKLFGLKVENYIVATINDKIMPVDRGVIYREPLDELLKSSGIGEVTGGGTMQLKSGEIEYCELEIKLNSNKINENDIQLIISKLEELGAPKGSKLTMKKTDQKNRIRTERRTRNLHRWCKFRPLQVAALHR